MGRRSICDPTRPGHPIKHWDLANKMPNMERPPGGLPGASLGASLGASPGTSREPPWGLPGASRKPPRAPGNGHGLAWLLSAPTESGISLRQPTGMGWLGFGCSKVMITLRLGSTQAPRTSLGDHRSAPTESEIFLCRPNRSFCADQGCNCFGMHSRYLQQSMAKARWRLLAEGTGYP